MTRNDIECQRSAICTVYLIQILMMILDIVFINIINTYDIQYIPILLLIVSVTILSINFAGIDTNIFYNAITEVYEGDIEQYVHKNVTVLKCIVINLIFKCIAVGISYRLIMNKDDKQLTLIVAIVNIIISNLYVMLIVLIKLWKLFYNRCLRSKPKIRFAGYQVNTYESFNF